jgi:hypothetical protein
VSKLSIFLLVEDNEDDVFFMKRAFKQAGLKNPLHIVTNGEEAIQYLGWRWAFCRSRKASIAGHDSAGLEDARV